MLDVALFMSNATRLKAVLEQGPTSQYYTALIALISVSLLLQVVIGILLVLIGEKPKPESGLLLGRPLVVGKTLAWHKKLPSHRLNQSQTPVIALTQRGCLPPVLAPYVSWEHSLIETNLSS